MSEDNDATPIQPNPDSDIQTVVDALTDLSNERDPGLAGQLARLTTFMAREASRSSRFAKALSAALDPDQTPDGTAGTSRPRRRSPGLFDPFSVYAETGDDGLRKRLDELNLEQLRDILAEHRLDHDRLAMKWKDASRVIDRIIERVAARSTKGSAFRS